MIENFKQTSKVRTFAKGFAMGCADIVPGVSGGTVAFITGIYTLLLESISSFDHNLLKLVLTGKIKEALQKINASFLFPLFAGILIAIISMAKVMHFLMNEYPVYTWSAFFGLILASIIFIGRDVENKKSLYIIVGLLLGTIVGYAVVSLIPVSMPHDLIYIFFSGMIGITAMILPGISGSFILLILGQYAYVTGALKAVTTDSNILIVLTFAAGCGVGIILFSKFLNWLMHTHRNFATVVLTGFMIGSLKKIWPWKEVLETKIIRGKVHILQEANVLPEVNAPFFGALGIMILGFSIVFVIEILSKPKMRGVSSAG